MARLALVLSLHHSCFGASRPFTPRLHLALNSRGARCTLMTDEVRYALSAARVGFSWNDVEAVAPAFAWRLRCCICCCQRESQCFRASDLSPVCTVCTDPSAELTSQIQDGVSGLKALNVGSFSLLATGTFFVGLPSTFSSRMLHGTLEQRDTLALASQYAFFSAPRPSTKRPAPESRASSARLLGLLRPVKAVFQSAKSLLKILKPGFRELKPCEQVGSPTDFCPWQTRLNIKL